MRVGFRPPTVHPPAAIRRDLPMPGSPEISTARPWPPFACPQRLSSSSSSSSRPISGVSRAAWSASKRLWPISLSEDLEGRHGILQAFQLHASQFATVEQVRQAVALWPHRPRCRFGSARACNRAARFGVSPIAVCWRASPLPIGSPITTRPVAIPMRTRRGFALDWLRANCLDTRQGGAYAPLGIRLAGLRPAEIGQHAVADVTGDEAAESRDSCGDPAS